MQRIISILHACDCCSNREPHFQLIKTSSIAISTVIPLESIRVVLLSLLLFFRSENSKIHRHILLHHLLARITVFFFQLIHQLTADSVSVAMKYQLSLSLNASNTKYIITADADTRGKAGEMAASCNLQVIPLHKQSL